MVQVGEDKHKLIDQQMKSYLIVTLLIIPVSSGDEEDRVGQGQKCEH